MGKTDSKESFGSYVPAWRVTKLRQILHDAWLTGQQSVFDSDAETSYEHRALRRRYTAGRQMAQKAGPHKKRNRLPSKQLIAAWQMILQVRPRSNEWGTGPSQQEKQLLLTYHARECADNGWVPAKWGTLYNFYRSDPSAKALALLGIADVYEELALPPRMLQMRVQHENRGNHDTCENVKVSRLFGVEQVLLECAGREVVLDRANTLRLAQKLLQAIRL